MNYTLVVRDAAVEDAAEAFSWYETQKSGLGMRFLLALDDCYAFIEANPLGYQLRKDDFRYARVEGFRYYRVVYGVVGTNISIYQVRHTSRRPTKRFGP